MDNLRAIQLDTGTTKPWYLVAKDGQWVAKIRSGRSSRLSDYELDKRLAHLLSAAPELYAVAAKIRSHVVLKQDMGQLDIKTVQELLAAMGKAEGV